MSQPTGQPAQPSAPTTTAQPTQAPGAPTTGQATTAAQPQQPTTQPPAAPPAQAPQAPGAPTQQGQQPPQVYVPPGYMLVPAQGQAPAQQGPQYVPVAPLPQAQPQEGNDPDRDISRLPGWAQSLITELRQENAQRRVSERAAVVTQHGLAAAQQLGVNPAALLSSVPWTEAARQLNPSDPEFPQKLTETIQRIVAASPWMKAETTQPQAQQPPAAPPPATSGGDFSAGSGSGVPITREQLAQMTPEQIAEAFKAGKLRHLLT